MFDAIAGRYDFLNHLLSAGWDRRWRRRAIRALGLTGRERLLDVCAGTGDLAIAAVKMPGAAGRAIAVDFSSEMLKLASSKIRAADLTDRVSVARGDAMNLPIRDGAAAAVAMAFGIRNVLDPGRACRECARVLQPGGRLAILEFGMPTKWPVAQLYRWYFRAVLPRVGRLVSKHADAYSYLPTSVGEFPPPPEFASMLRGAGFQSVTYVPLTLGVVYLYSARK